MAKTVSSLVRVLALAGATGLLGAGPAFGEALDGQSFEGVFIAKGKTRGDADTLTFKNGRFRSSACDKYGYSDATYKTTNEGDAIRFEAQTQSAKHGTLRWAGFVRGDKLDATVMEVRDGKAPVENWVAAGLKK